MFSLIAYSGETGLRALFSFVASIAVLFKVLIPGLLGGMDPIRIGFMSIVLLSAIIIFSVAGFTRKGFSAFLGTISGLCISLGITLFFGEGLSIGGMSMPYSQALIFSGHFDLDMKKILYCAIIIGASGAVMDIAMDISASIEEIKKQRPDITMKQLMASGLNIGKTVIGTMTTTLLLAYTGGYLTLIMLFTTKESSAMRIMNMKIISTEILRTLSGSIGLIVVAPLTAVIASWIFSRESTPEKDLLKPGNDEEARPA